ncbi:MAG: hypothetical protein M3246_09015 [Actinomycetota bacterium]|nr:hypothetical protein [Actinomycetota bacterium]
MANATTTADGETVARDEVHAEEERRYYYSWLEDYLERLEGKDAYREFQEHHCNARDEYYYALMASLSA